MKIRKVAMLVLMFGLINIVPVYAQEEEENIFPEYEHFFIVMNGCKLICHRDYYKIDGELYFPLRAVSEEIGMSVMWNGESKEISINRDNEKLFRYEDFEKKLYGYKNNLGDIIIPPTYYYAGDFCNGRAYVTEIRNGLHYYGYIDEIGDFVIPAVYKSAGDFKDGIASVSVGDVSVTDNDDSYVYIDTDGNQIFEKDFLLAYGFSEGLAVVLKSGFAFPVPREVGMKREWSYITKDGEYATELTFDEAMPFENGIAKVCVNNKWAAIDHSFQYVTEQYNSYSELINALNAAKENKKYASESKIRVDGQIMPLKKDSFIVNDCTYVSLTDIGELLDYNASWSTPTELDIYMEVLCLDK